MTEGSYMPHGPLGFGGAPLGNMFEVLDEATAQGALDAAWDAGIRFYDTAPFYGSGLSEHRFGHALRQRPREAFTLSTKVGRLLRPDRTGPDNPSFKHPLPFRIEHDYTRDGALRSIEDSLQRLGLAEIDIALIHDPAADHFGDEWEEVFATAMSGAARALSELRDQGVVKAWGLGVNLTEPCIRALEQSEPDIFLLAGRYSLLNQPALDALFPACAARGAKIIVGGPYNSGLLAGGGTYEYAAPPSEMIAKRDRIAEICARHRVDMRAAALQFCAAHPVVTTVIPGACNAQEARENSRLIAQAIPGDFWLEMKSAGILPEAAPVPSAG